jgi:hypothetical protein
VKLFILLAGAALVVEPEYDVRRTVAGTEALLSAPDEVWHATHGISWGPPEYPTEFRALWSDSGLYLRFDVADEDPWHTMRRHDDPLWEEEVVEIFIDPGGTGTHYVEVEWNPANVVTDLHIISGMPNKKADIHWGVEGLESRARLNRDNDGKITGWTVTALLPWSGFQSLPSTSDIALPPRSGDRWRFNVFRIERPGGKSDPDHDVILAAWSPPPGRSFHVPEVFGDLVFTDQ